ncbi:ATP-binding protein [Raoultibacter timonensis]|uniref:ATP-binding protein n=1 Tax=Raoultibacter timonensis TaxID=1907662 RepID=UPI000C833DC5|nr:GHKL domain-containing protein [Raoultibacter timonensis]
MISGYFLDTTGIIWQVPCLLECLVFFVLVRPLQSRRPLGWPAAWAAIALVAYQMLVTYLHQQFSIDFFLCLAGYFSYLAWEKSSSKQQDLYVSCVFILCVEAGKIVALDLFMQPFVDLFSQWSPLALTLLNFGLTFGVLAAISLLVSRWLFDNGAENLTWTQCLSILLPILPFMLLRSRSYAYENADTPLYQDMVLTLLLLLGSIIVIIVVNAANLSSVVKKAELLQMEALLREQHQHYAMKKNAVDAVRRQYHDLKHYLGTLESSHDIGQVQAFVEGMSQSISPYEAFVETGNEAVDIILADKAALCQSELIRLVPYVDASRLGFMTSFELCALFGNALDNAIEATAPLGEEALREIALKVSYDRNLMVMRVNNNFVGELSKRGQRLATTKSQREGHGFGLDSIEEIAQKHGGAMSFEAKDGVFVLNVVIPVPA